MVDLFVSVKRKAEHIFRSVVMLFFAIYKNITWRNMVDFSKACYHMTTALYHASVVSPQKFLWVLCSLIPQRTDRILK
jgi:hypothetical protein